MSWSTIVLVTYMCLKWWKSSYMKNVRCDTVTLSPSLSFPFCAPLTLFPLFLGVEPLSGKFVQCCEYEQHHRISSSPPSFLKCGLPAFLQYWKGNFEDWIGRLILRIAQCSNSSWRCRLYWWRTCKLRFERNECCVRGEDEKYGAMHTAHYRNEWLGATRY